MCIFQHNRYVVIFFLTDKKKKNKKSKTTLSYTRLDHSSLASGHHNVLLAALTFLPTMFVRAQEDHQLEHVHVLQIGLGGGALSQFINKNLHNVCPVRLCQRKREGV